MHVAKALMSVAALSLASAPALAAPVANPAARLSVAKPARAGATTKQNSRLGGSGTIIAIVGLIAVGVLVAVVASSDDSDSP